MSLAHRRAHLMGIFYYRNPESRARRIAKMVEEAEQLAERKGKSTVRKSKKSDLSLEP
jgi:hypothetical protein